ncbi:hypothetical protein PA3_25460 [Acinetobacter pittii]|uniref:PAAR domain-containing protein n=1 Tax=Acinetobacter pittii TaxID=48296 RepID=A0A4Y3JBR5_ACIPI|nr:PAAR domain-containing protein [Acinetobacter pittii]GEA68388.1 hypothetical protein PA3_25460 [Acinetobacter pittii]
MTSPTFLRDLSYEQLQDLSENDIQQILNAENLYWQNKPFIKYYIAVNGAKTKNGGLIRASGHHSKLKGISLALVGDEAIYADGTTAKIITGAGEALTIEGQSVALIGSYLDNNDEIIDSPNKSVYICIYHDQPKPLGFLSNI